MQTHIHTRPQPNPDTAPEGTPLTGRRPARVEATEAPRPVRLAPALDVFENADELRLDFEVPGVAQGDVLLEIADETLRLEAMQSQGVGLRAVRFERTIALPATVDSTAVSAELALGVLHVRLPKREEVKPRTIPVRGSDAAG